MSENRDRDRVILFNDPDLNETARLILMEDKGSLIRFAKALKEHYPQRIFSVEFVAKLYERYVGVGAQLPTHSIETGERIQR